MLFFWDVCRYEGNTSLRNVENHSPVTHGIVSQDCSPKPKIILACRNSNIMWRTTEQQTDTNRVNIRSLRTYLVFSFSRVAITLRTSTAAPLTALHDSEELWCDVCSDGKARVKECVEIYHDGEQVLMIGVLKDNGHKRDQMRDRFDNRGINVDQSAS